MITTQLYFMPDVEVVCAACKGARFNSETLVVTVRGKTIHDILTMSVEEGMSFFEREPAVGSVTGRAGVRTDTRQSADHAYAEFRYEDDSGPQVYLMTQDEISVGRGGDNVAVNLALYTNDEVSREHLRVRRDRAHGRFLIVDLSMNGTWLNGKRLTRGVEEALPARSQISVAEVITLEFEARS